MQTKQILLPLSLFALGFTSPASFAANNNGEPGLHGSGEAGYSEHTGNTVNTDLFGALKLNYATQNNELKSVIEVSYKSENKIQTQERYNIELQNNRFYNQAHNYFSFIRAQLEKNRFEDIELDTTISVGLGKNLFKNTDTKLTSEIGIGKQFTQYTQSSAAPDQDQTIARLKLALSHQINTQVSFLQEATYSTGNTQSKLESNTSFKIKIADQMKLKASYKYRYNDQPAAGVEKVDTQTLITLIYDF